MYTYRIHTHEPMELKMLEDYRICLMTCKGDKVIYNLKPRLDTLRFADVRDRELFMQGKLVDGRIIRWNENTELAVEEIIRDILERTVDAGQRKGERG